MTNAASPQGSSHPARRFPRYALDMKLSVHVFRDGKTVSYWGRSTEFAEDGLSATLTGEVEAGEVVSLELSLPHVAFPLKLRALVRYRQGLRHGVEFLARNEDQHRAIREVCESLASRE
jgi:PilZ domain-containing protein